MSDDTREELAARRGLDQPVYQPAEDSGLLASAGREHATGVVVEVGTGSGWVAQRVAESPGVDCVVGTDVNPHACREARERGVESARVDLVSALATDAVDTLLFNPPYLPTDPEAEWDDWQEAALSGGTDGRAVIEPFLDAAGRVLAPDGQVLLLVSSLTGFADVVEYAVARGFDAETVAEESYPYESLSVLRLTYETAE
ncbi:HemK2/MTQ2 family protein methyltransferase [Halobaculum sp. MBLA0147]|uniref:HemK2/MTQ2 family protein methyltransferase n=1 Tax=Halobaculum sp. MBLA0147 TaxID=3079934 RepID=UPI00352549C8